MLARSRETSSSPLPRSSTPRRFQPECRVGRVFARRFSGALRRISDIWVAWTHPTQLQALRERRRIDSQRKHVFRVLRGTGDHPFSWSFAETDA
jgi:hypothetical protein